MNKSGIYCWVCEPTNQVYIGQSIDVNTRQGQHLYALRSGKHGNTKLQDAFSKHGENNFKFKIIQRCPPDMLNHMEDYYIKKFDSIENGFNIQSGSLKYRKQDYIGNIDVQDCIYDLDEYSVFINNHIYELYDAESELNVEVAKDVIKELNFEFNKKIDINYLAKIIDRLNLNFYLHFYKHDSKYATRATECDYYIKISSDIAIDIYNKNFKNLDSEILEFLKLDDKYMLKVDFFQHKNKKDFSKRVSKIKDKVSKATSKHEKQISELSMKYLTMSQDFFKNLSLEINYLEIADTIKKRDDILNEINKIKTEISDVVKQYIIPDDRYMWCEDGYVISYIKERIYDYKDFKQNYRNMLFEQVS